MPGNIHRLIVAAALALPPALATCKSSSEPTTATTNIVLTGNSKPGLVGYAVNVRPAVHVTDRSGNALVGMTVAFAVASGGGSVTGAVRTTDGNGTAQVGSWVLGAAPGLNTLTATVTGAGIPSRSATFADTGYAAGFTITIQPYGAGLPPDAQAAFDSAVAKWQRIIYRPLGAVNLNVLADACAPGTPAYTGTTTGLVIFASVDSIDGLGATLAEAAPCYVRTPGGQALVGMMKFDSADIKTLITNLTLNSVVLHEMNHVLGFGTLWNHAPFSWLQLPSTLPSPILNTYFSGPKALAAFDSAGGMNYTGGNKVPVENCGTAPYVPPRCGAGTVNTHWREVVMTNELMTGFINGGGPNPLSIVSVAADEDLGYVVNYSAADPYLHTFTAPPAGGAATVWLGNDVRRLPIRVVDAHGAVVRVVSPR